MKKSRTQLHEELLIENTYKANKLLSRIMFAFTGVMICTLIVAIFGLLKEDISLMHLIKCAIYLVTVMLVLMILKKAKLSEDLIKYYIGLSIHVFILTLASDGSIPIYCTFLLAPIISLAYFDKNYTYIMCVISYVVMEISLFSVAEYRVGNQFQSYTKLEWFLSFSLGYTLEFVALIFGIYLVATSTERMMYSLSERSESVINLQKNVITGFAGLVESRDGDTGEHVKRTESTVKIIIDSMIENGIYSDLLDKEKGEIIQMAAPLHDIGKIKIEDAILCKPGELTEEEFAKMKYHADEGERIIQKYLKDMEEEEFIKAAREIALSHHERWDGQGYPNKLKGEEIPLSARIMAVADVFDALVSKRCYKEAMPFEEAYQTVLNESGTHFDPQVVKAFTLKKNELQKMYEIKSKGL